MNRSNIHVRRQPIVVAPAIARPTKQQRAKRFRRIDKPAAIHLTDRDTAVLAALSEHRFLSCDQLRRLVFDCSPSRTRRRLRVLFDHGFIERISLNAQPSRGIPPYVHVLTGRGAAALEEIGMVVVNRGVNASSIQFARHKLLVNHFFISLVESTRNSARRLLNWRHEQQLKLPTADGRGRVEQITHPSLEKPMSFLPDGFFEIEVRPGRIYAFFLEMDLATHSQRVWRERAKLYSAYADAQAGHFRRRFGRENFRLLIVAPPDFRGRSRRDNILQSILGAIGPSDLFLAATLADVAADRILTPVWKQPGSARLLSIVDEPAARSAVVVRRRTR